MIGKNVDIKDRVAKTARARMSALCAYVEKGKDVKKVEAVWFVNAFDDRTGDAEIIALSESNPRAKMPLRHIVFSWKSHERPTAAQAKEAALIALKEMDLDGCVAKCALHKDTDNLHLHIVVCTVDPGDFSMVQTHFIEKNIHRSLAIMEHRQGWESQSRALYRVDENGECLLRNKTTTKKTPSEKADRIAVFTGTRSVQDIAIELVPAILKKAVSWQDLHARFAAAGMVYQANGSGAVVGVRQGQEMTFVKASSTARDAALSKLKKRLGEFQVPAGDLLVARREMEPSRHLNAEWAVQWRQYQAERQLYSRQRRETTIAQRKDSRQAFFSLIARQRAERGAVFANRDWQGRGTELAALRSVVAARHAAEKAVLRNQLAVKRSALWAARAVKFPRSLAEWVAARGNRQSIGELQGPLQPAKPRDIRAYTPAVIGRYVQYQSAAGRVHFVDAGRSITVLTNDPASLAAAIQLAAEKWSQMAINGSAEFRARIVKEMVRQGLEKKILNPDLQRLAAQKRAKLHEVSLVSGGSGGDRLPHASAGPGEEIRPPINIPRPVEQAADFDFELDSEGGGEVPS